MASKFISGALSGGRNTLDVPVAALAGLSVAFVAFAAPSDVLADLIGSTGIASLIPAAEPPLGMRARIGIGAAGAVLVFAAAFLLLRWLDRFGSRGAERVDEAEQEVEPPRLRRRDFHPDAAPRPPLSAASELGEPEAEDVLELEATSKPEPEPEYHAQVDHQPEPDYAREPYLAEPEPEPEPEPEAEPAHGVSPPAPRDWFDEEMPDIVEEPLPAALPRVPAPVPAAAPPAYGHSIPELLDRLEQGLARRRSEEPPPAAAPTPVPQPAPSGAAEPVQSEPPQVFPEAADNRLQSAINSLQRLAARPD
jgi:hypothetical protein